MRYFFIFLCLCTYDLIAQVQIDTTTDLSFVQSYFLPSQKVIIDGAHNNLHKAYTGFKPLVLLLAKLGFSVSANESNFQNAVGLSENTLLIIANPIASINRGRPFNPIHSAFSPEEISSIQHWVLKGGKLLLIADHMPFAGAMVDLAKAFEIEYVNGFVDATTDRWPPRTFYSSNHSFNNSHKLFKHLDSISSFTGSALKLPVQAIPLFRFSASDTIILTDTAWSFSPELARKSLGNYVQGGLMKYGKGKVAVFGEAAMFTAQTIIPQGIKAGFNSEYAPQNIEFIKALLQWMFDAEN